MMDKNLYNSKKIRNTIICVAICLILIIFIISLFIGKYPLTINGIFTNNAQKRIFLNLRLPRALVGLFGGFSLGIAGFIFQTIFKNKLASPDIIGISSGASVGAAIAILFLASSFITITISAFLGAIVALLITVIVMLFVPTKNKANIVLVGIAIQAICQMSIMSLKMIADPEKELASIEYWIMGGLNGITLNSIYIIIPTTIICTTILLLLFRQIMLLSLSDTDSKILGLSTNKIRWIILLLSTLLVASVICVTGLVSFVSLLSAHIARLILKRDDKYTFILSGIMGAFILLLADILARSVYTSELPISIFTSLLGAPFLIFLLVRRTRNASSIS